MPRHRRTPWAAAGFALAAALSVGAAPSRTQAAPVAAATPTYSIEQFLATVSWLGAEFSPDGTRLLAAGNPSGVFNAYAIPVAGGAPVPLTDSKVSAVFPDGWFPSGGRILYETDQGGNEQTHLYVRDAAGSVRDLTPGDKLKAQFAGWSPDDKSFFFATNERDAQFFDLYEMSVDSYQRTLLYRNDGGFALGPISRDRRYVALIKRESTSDSDIWLYDRTTGKVRNLTPHGAAVEVANLPQDWSPDGASLYYTSTQGSEFADLMRYDLASGTSTPVLRAGWDVEFASFSRDGRYFEVGIDHDAHTELRLYTEPGMRPVALPEIADANLSAITFSRDGRHAAFYAESSRSPRNLFVADADAGSARGEFGLGAPRQLTRALAPDIDPQALVAAQVVRFKSYDGVEIPGLLYRPQAASAARPAPALVWVHGGPGGQSRVGYSALIQFLVNHGYAVYAINNRGSSGYGKTFFRMADRKHGDADLGDCVASKQMLRATGWVQPDGIGIVGGSYGGYMVLAALAFRPHEFAVGVDMYGVSNWLRTLSSMPAYWGSQRKALLKMIGDPQVDADYLRKISPLFHADQIERPLIVLQGENDPRVLKPESDEIVAAARKRGTPVEYLIFPNEGHGFIRKESQIRSAQGVLDFLNKYLPTGGAVAAATATRQHP